jgi:hypothetical protein
MRLLVLLAVAATTAYADQQLPNGAVVGELSYEGDGCPPGTADGQAAPDGTYGIVFSAMEAVGNGPGMTQASCSLSVPVQLPPNMRMTIAGVLVEGKHEAPAGTKTAVCTNYNFDPTHAGDASMRDWWFYKVNVSERSAAAQFEDMNDRPGLDFVTTARHGIGSAAGNFGAVFANRSQVANRRYFSHCGERVNFQGMLVLMAERGHDAAGAPEIALQRLDTQSYYNLGWTWRFERCANPYDGVWELNWRDLSGIGRRSRATFRNAGGSIAGHGISFEQIVYDRDYVRGRWRHTAAPDAPSGWLRIAAPAPQQDPVHPVPTARFSGEWGLGEVEGEQTLGAWSAVRTGD